jgi:hypothetical protein
MKTITIILIVFAVTNHFYEILSEQKNEGYFE